MINVWLSLFTEICKVVTVNNVELNSKSDSKRLGWGMLCEHSQRPKQAKSWLKVIG